MVAWCGCAEGAAAPGAPEGWFGMVSAVCTECSRPFPPPACTVAVEASRRQLEAGFLLDARDHTRVMLEALAVESLAAVPTGPGRAAEDALRAIMASPTRAGFATAATGIAAALGHRRLLHHAGIEEEEVLDPAADAAALYERALAASLGFLAMPRGHADADAAEKQATQLLERAITAAAAGSAAAETLGFVAGAVAGKLPSATTLSAAADRPWSLREAPGAAGVYALALAHHRNGDDALAGALFRVLERKFPVSQFLMNVDIARAALERQRREAADAAEIGRINASLRFRPIGAAAPALMTPPASPDLSEEDEGDKLLMRFLVTAGED